MLAIFLPTVIVIIAILILLLAVYVSRDVIQTQVGNHLLTTAQSRAHNIETLLNDYKETVQVLAVGIPFTNILDQNIDYTQRMNECDLRIQRTIECNPKISRIRILDNNGIVLSSSHEDIGFDQSKEEIFSKGKEGIHFGEIHFSNFTHDLVISISTPIFLRSKVSGVLIINFKVEKELFTIIADKTGLGETGEIYLVNKDRHMLAPSQNYDKMILETNANASQVNLCFDEHIINKLPGEMKGKATVYIDYRGNKVLGTHYYIQEMKWCLIAEIDIKEAYKPVNKMVMLLIYIFLVLLFTSVSMVVIISSNILSRIMKLYAGTEEIIKGNLDYKVGTNKKDEIGLLSRAFDKMTQNLKISKEKIEKYTGELEDKVKKRTTEINEKIKESDIQRIATVNIANDLEEANISLTNEVIERKKAEESLRKSEGKYRLLAENTLDCIWKMDKELKFTYINQSILLLLGFTREEWTGSKLAEHCSKKEMQHFMNIVENELRKKDTYSAMFEMNLIHKNGKEIPLEILGKILLDESNKVAGFQGNARDITERIQADRIQKTFYDISNALNTIENINELFDRIREFLNNIIDTTNFYVALYDEKTKIISLYYVVDEKDNISSFSAGKTLTDYVINTGKPLLAKEKVLKKLIRSGKVIIAGTPPKAWLGVPLKIENKVTGVVAVHSYIDANLYSEKDMGILEFVSDEIARAIIRKQAEKELKESEESYRGLFNSATDAIYIQDKNGVFVDVNDGAINMYGYPPEFFIGKTPEFLSAPYKNDMKKVLKMVHKAYMGKPQRFEFYGKRKNGEIFPKELQLNNGTYFGEKVVIAFARDITKRKQIERTQQALYNIANAVNTTKDMQELFDEIRKQLGTVIDTTNFFVAFYDEKTEALTLPYEKDEEDEFGSFPTGKSMTSYNIQYGKPLLATEEFMNQLTEESKIDDIGTMCKIWLGVPLKVEDKTIGLVVVQSYDDPDLYTEKDLEILSFVSDEIALAIEHKKAEDQIVNSLKEKEILLMEIHHRVKNNMQIISSLLKLQAGYVKDEEALELFQNSQNRVKSMSLIHEKIYRSKDLASVDFEDYVKSLSYNLFSNYGINTNKVLLELKVAKHSIDMNKAIPCGLIVNELLSNSLKHAFPKGKSGKIVVGLSINENDEFELTVEDNGIGMQQEINLDNLDSLGLQLIDALTSQLKGKITFDSNNGMKTKLVFPS
jgi:PAS domain S-box-containing protein